MRIGENSTPRPVDPAGSKIQNASPAPASSTNAGVAPVSTGSGDVLELGQGKELLQLAFELSAITRQSRVDEIRQRLAAGDYLVSPDDVSRAIVEDMVSRGIPISSLGLG
jgi:anti-sigma28 factor (negative regulator of flagellin synthesis)